MTESSGFFFKKSPFFSKKGILTLHFLNSQISFPYYLIKIRLSKFENNCLKTGGHFNKLVYFFAFLVCVFLKEPIEL